MAAYRRVDDLRSAAGWLPVHRDQLRAQRSVSSMGSLYLFYYRPLIGSDNLEWPSRSIHRLQVFSNGIFRTVVQTFNWHRASRGLSATAEFLVRNRIELQRRINTMILWNKSLLLIYLLLLFILLHPPKEDMYSSLFVCLSVSNFAQKFPTKLAWNFQVWLAMGQRTSG